MRKRVWISCIFLCFGSLLFARGTELTLGIGGSPSHSWSSLASGGTTGSVGGDTLLFPGNPVSLNIQVVETGDFTGSFDLALGGTSPQAAQTVVLAASRDGTLVVDRLETVAGGDDYNININEELSFSLSDIDIAASDGGNAELRLQRIELIGLNESELLDVRFNGALVIDDLGGAGSNNSFNDTVIVRPISNALVEGDTVELDLVSGVNYRVQSVVFEIVSLGGGDPDPEPEPEPDLPLVVGSLESGAGTGLSWRELAAGGALGTSGATSFPSDPLVVSVPVDTDEVVGSFELIFDGNGESRVVEYLDRLSIDRVGVEGPADDRNINDIETLEVRIGAVDLLARRGGHAHLRMRALSVDDLNEGEFLQLSLDGALLPGELAGEGASGADEVIVFDLPHDGVILESGSHLSLALGGPAFADYRLDSLQFSTFVTVPAYSAKGDGYPNINAIYPDAAFALEDVLSNPERWDGVDDKKMLNAVEHFGAVGDGNPETASVNTAAFQAMFDFLKARQAAIDAGQPRSINPEEPAAQWIFYIPDGIYYVDDTLSDTGAVFEYFRGIRIFGQSRAGTEIRLVDEAVGFGDAATPKALLSFRNPDDDFNNWQGHNMLKNITIDVGSGNPGAVAVDYFSPNTGRIDNVTLRSPGGSNGYAGAIGLNLKVGIVHGFFSHLTIEGFDVGINLEPYHMCNPTLEHVTLKNQREAGIKAIDGGASLREVLSLQERTDADAAAMVLDSGSLMSAGAHVVIVDSQFVSFRPDGSERSAIEVVNGHLFARDIGVEGYVAGVSKKGAIAIEGNVNEYVSDAPIGFDSSASIGSMRMAVEDYPQIPWEEDLENWACPEDYLLPGDADDTASIQRALDSGKAVIYFPKQYYSLSESLSVPASVKRIDLMATEFGGSALGYYFDVAEASADVLTIQDLNDSRSPLLRYSAERTLFLESNRNSSLRFNGVSGQKLFVNNANKFIKYLNVEIPLESNTAWCRFVNTEDKVNPNWVIGEGGAMWVLGYKCEGATVNFKVRDGGVLEVLGGIANQFPNDQGASNAFNAQPYPDNAAFVNLGGHLSVVACTSGPTSPSFAGFQRLLFESKGDEQLVLGKSDLPARLGRPDEVVLPLYASYDAASIPGGPFAVNTTPSIGTIDSLTLDVGKSSEALVFSIDDVETAADRLSVEASSSDESIVAPSGIELGGSGSTRTLTLTPVAGALGRTTVTVTVSDGSLSASSHFEVSVEQLSPKVAAAPVDDSVTAFEQASFTVVALGADPITFQWRKDGIEIDGATEATFLIPSARVADAGAYDVLVRNRYGSAASSAASLTVAKAPALVTLGNLDHTYDGAAKSATVGTLPEGLAVELSYDGSASEPVDAGSYTVQARVQDENYAGSATGNLRIEPSLVEVVISQLYQSYDGLPKEVSVATEPKALQVSVSYEGESSPPQYPGDYEVTALVEDRNYLGAARETLRITTAALVGRELTLGGDVIGSVQVGQAEDSSLVSQATIAGDLLTVGTPEVDLSGPEHEWWCRLILGAKFPSRFGVGGRVCTCGKGEGPSDSALPYEEIRYGDGSADPSGHVVSLSPKSSMRYLVSRVDAPEMPEVEPIAEPRGTRSVTLRRRWDEMGDIATLRDLQVCGFAGLRELPPGSYGAVRVGGLSGLILGVEGALEPSVYEFQSFDLGMLARVELVGPVVLRIEDSVTLLAGIGKEAHPEWLEIQISDGGLTLSGWASECFGYVLAPRGTVSLSGGSRLVGEIVADRLEIFGNATLEQPGW